MLAALVCAFGCGAKTTSPVGPGALAPTSALRTTEGRDVYFDELAGKVVVLGFFASWCAPSLAAVSALSRVREQHTDSELVVLAVDVNEGRDTMIAIARARGVTLPLARDIDGRVAQQMGIPAIPSIAVIDRQGVVRFVHAGYHGSDEIADVLSETTALLLQPAPPAPDRPLLRPPFESTVAAK